MWIEAAWQDEQTGYLFAWYHHEPQGVCGSVHLTAPKIGALFSADGGHSFQDLGIILEAGEPVDCTARNGFFAGGHGDFSVIPDREHGYFYFFFGNYGGPVERQGISVARMAFVDRWAPVGTVWKYADGEWNEPGIGGRVTPIFRAQRSWQVSDTDSFWGPSIHWNVHLQRFVILLNRSCCSTGWPQEGIYITFNAELDNPTGWRTPQQILSAEALGFSPAWYPQVAGMIPGETDSTVGETARLYVKGISEWMLVFDKAGDKADCLAGKRSRRWSCPPSP
jgi:hypothetical protein